MSEKRHNLLFVDDEEDIISALYDTFSDTYNVFKTTDAKEALAIVKREEIALIISDQRMPEMTGSELLAQIYDDKPETMRILLTGYADINAAIEAINRGAIHKYVEKPWNDDELTALVASLVQIYEESKENLSLLVDVEQVIQRESSYRPILNSVKEGVCAVDEEQAICFANTRALQLLCTETIDGIKLQKLFNITADDIKEFAQEFTENKKVKGRIFTSGTGDNSPVDVLLFPVFSDEGQEMVGVIFQGI